MSSKSEKEKCGALLYIIGQSRLDVHNTVTFSEEETDRLLSYLESSNRTASLRKT